MVPGNLISCECRRFRICFAHSHACSCSCAKLAPMHTHAHAPLCLASTTIRACVCEHVHRLCTIVHAHVCAHTCMHTFMSACPLRIPYMHLHACTYVRARATVYTCTSDVHLCTRNLKAACTRTCGLCTCAFMHAHAHAHVVHASVLAHFYLRMSMCMC